MDPHSKKPNNFVPSKRSRTCRGIKWLLFFNLRLFSNGDGGYRFLCAYVKQACPIIQTSMANAINIFSLFPNGFLRGEIPIGLLEMILHVREKKENLKMKEIINWRLVSTFDLKKP